MIHLRVLGGSRPTRRSGFLVGKRRSTALSYSPVGPKPEEWNRCEKSQPGPTLLKPRLAPDECASGPARVVRGQDPADAAGALVTREAPGLHPDSSTSPVTPRNCGDRARVRVPGGPPTNVDVTRGWRGAELTGLHSDSMSLSLRASLLVRPAVRPRGPPSVTLRTRGLRPPAPASHRPERRGTPATVPKRSVRARAERWPLHRSP